MFGAKKRLKKNNDILFKRNTELNKMCIELQQKGILQQNEIDKLKETNENLEQTIVITSELYETKKKECKMLKQLLTRNKIPYKKEG